MGKSSVNLWESWDCYDPIDTLQCWCFILPVGVPRLSTPCEAAALQQRVEKIQEAFESGSGGFFENLKVLTWKKWVTWIGKLSRNVGNMSRILDDHQFPEMAMRYAHTDTSELNWRRYFWNGLNPPTGIVISLSRNKHLSPWAALVKCHLNQNKPQVQVQSLRRKDHELNLRKIGYLKNH